MKESCVRCGTKSCQKSKFGTLDICEYGVAFYNDSGKILKKEEAVTLRHMSQNLRHELNKVLQTIVSEASTIDSSVSTKYINMHSPASRIVGATVIIDQFIEMISGVNDFHPSRSYSENLEKKVNLYAILDKYIKIHSLIINTRRAKDLSFEINCERGIFVSFAANIVDNIVSILIDNIWKYSCDNTKVEITAATSLNGYLNLEFSNISEEIRSPEEVFSKGYQQDELSEGFGFGLYWAKLLCEHYNELSGRVYDLFNVTHEQILDGKSRAKQVFTIRNVRI